ncbi:hypothetical protein [Micromonospora sp. DT41]|uniref:endonuclease toxin domain-containing protein n=1 Tax=Micromonospora sp. DT41 TaxID=3393437 RepID=UPI003CF565BF
MLWINDGGGKYVPPAPVLPSPMPSPKPAPGKGGSGQGGRPALAGTPSPSPQGAPLPISCIPEELCKDPLVEAAVGFVPFSDAPDCLQGDKLACGFTAMDAVPGGKIANGIGAVGSALVTARRLGKYADDFEAGRGLWNLPFRQRGYALEKRILDEMGLKGLPTPNNPTIDAFDFATGTATSVKTKALHEAYYSGKRLQGELRRDVRKLERYDGRTFGDAVIDQADIKRRQLIVGIPSGTVSSEQYAAMVDGYNYGLERGVHVMYVIVK